MQLLLSCYIAEKRGEMEEEEDIAHTIKSKSVFARGGGGGEIYDLCCCH
jgi:hypothetical protein